MMYCRVKPLFEGGKLIPEWRVRQYETYDADLTIEPSLHEAFHRHMRVAMLINPVDAGGKNEAVLPYLYDACVVAASRDWMRVSGFYWDDASKFAVAQTWHVIFLAKDYRDWVAIDSAEKARKYDEEMKRKSEVKK
jgi:hypothetical protein